MLKFEFHSFERNYSGSGIHVGPWMDGNSTLFIRLKYENQTVSNTEITPQVH